jgi:glycosyltransferase involved in cell wall biosynthesis
LGSTFFVFAFLGSIFSLPVIAKIPRTGDGAYLPLVRRSLWRYLLFQVARRSVSHFVILTPDGRDELKLLGVADRQIREIPNGVEVPSPRERERNANTLRLVFAGRLIPRKRVGLIIDALFPNTVANARSPVTLDILGDGPDREGLERAVDERGIRDLVRFHGDVPLDVVFATMRDCDAFVLASISEGMSNALIQAMARGCVPVVCDTIQNRIVVQHMENGLVFETAGHLAEQIEMLRNGPLYARLSTNALRSVMARYSAESVAQAYSDLYLECVGRRARTLKS